MIPQAQSKVDLKPQETVFGSTEENFLQLKHPDPCSCLCIPNLNSGSGKISWDREF